MMVVSYSSLLPSLLSIIIIIVIIIIMTRIITVMMIILMTLTTMMMMNFVLKRKWEFKTESQSEEKEENRLSKWNAIIREGSKGSQRRGKKKRKHTLKGTIKQEQEEGRRGTERKEFECKRKRGNDFVGVRERE